MTTVVYRVDWTKHAGFVSTRSGPGVEYAAMPRILREGQSFNVIEVRYLSATEQWLKLETGEWTAGIHLGVTYCFFAGELPPPPPPSTPDAMDVTIDDHGITYTGKVYKVSG